MAVVATVPEGWTTRLTFTLLSDGSAINGTGITLTALLLTGKDGTVIDTTSKAGWVTAASGTVYYDPGATDLTANRSPYRMRWKLTDGSGKVAFHPSGDADTLVVVPVR